MGSHPQAQNDLIWNIKDELKKACSTNDLKELLIFNQQQVPSGESAVSCLCVGGNTKKALKEITAHRLLQLGGFPSYTIHCLMFVLV